MGKSHEVYHDTTPPRSPARHRCKLVDNRTWETTYHGWLAIHAGQGESSLSDGDMERHPDMAFAAIVAVTHMAGCADINHIARPSTPLIQRG